MNDDILAIIAALDKLSAELEQRAPSKWRQSGNELCHGEFVEPRLSLSKRRTAKGQWKNS